MNILLVAAEGAPFVKVGGLGDVMGALPEALQRLGHAVRVILPHHGPIDDERFGLAASRSFDMLWNGSNVRVEVARVMCGDVPHYFLRGWPYFAPHEPFIYHEDEGIDVGRFLFFSAASLVLARHMAAEGWAPDVSHAQDWHTALVPYLLKTVYHDDPALRRAATVFSVHNLQYQGWGVGWHLAQAGLPGVTHPLLLAAGRADNSMAIGLAYSDMLSTVSPRYAFEITTGEGGFGLDGIIHARLARLEGILNGIDVQRWNPAASHHIAQRYSADDMAGRVENKLALQAELGLPQRAGVPLIGTVLRLVEQKGPSIMMPAVREVLATEDAQFVLLGTGADHFEDDARRLGQDFPDRAAIRLTFNEPLSERIYAASDIFLMPSLFEPCGLGQMIAMRYGALPLVRDVGGLADTVTPEVGFLFGAFDTGALAAALRRALDAYRTDPAGWNAVQQRAMRTDHSWVRSAAAYITLYERAIALHRQYA